MLLFRPGLIEVIAFAVAFVASGNGQTADPSSGPFAQTPPLGSSLQWAGEEDVILRRESSERAIPESPSLPIPNDGKRISRAERKPPQKFSFSDFMDSIRSLVRPGDPGARDRLKLTLSQQVGYDDNILTTQENPIGSLTTSTGIALSYNFGSPRLKFNARLAAGVVYFQDRPGDKIDSNVAFVLTSSYRISRRLLATVNTTFSYLSQPNPIIVGGVSRFLGDYYYTNAGLGFTYSLQPILSAELGYNINGIRYVEEAVNESSGFYQQSFSLSLNYLVLPRTALVVEYRYNPITYYASNLGSDGHLLLFGISQQFTPRLKARILSGAEYRSLQQPGDGPSSYIGPFVEGNASYQFGMASGINFGFRFGTEPSGVSNIAIRRTLRGNLGVRHSITGRLLGEIGVTAEADNYDQPGEVSDFNQNFYTAYASLKYQMTLFFAATLRYDYSIVDSELPGTSYRRNVVSLGIEIVF